MTYPKDWPRCPVCNDFALDGHITCGRVECNESGQRNKRADEYIAHVQEFARRGKAAQDAVNKEIEKSK